MARVSAVEGIRYGFSIMAYYVVVILIGNLIMGIGGGMMGAGLETAGLHDSPDWGTVIIGFVVFGFGLLSVLAGVFGAVYKLIADGVAKGNELSRTG